MTAILKMHLEVVISAGTLRMERSRIIIRRHAMTAGYQVLPDAEVSFLKLYHAVSIIMKEKKKL